MHVAIVGAGIAGLSAGTALSAAGHRVAIFDKGRGAGGRMATRRVNTPVGQAQFDHGAQYFTIRDPAFAACVRKGAELGLAACWPAVGDDAWVGTPTMNAPLKAMASALHVEWNTRIDLVAPCETGWRLHGDGLTDTCSDAIAIGLPAEQAAALLAPINGDLAGLAAARPSAPCWTVMAAFAQPVLASSDVLVADGGAIGWAARNSAKPGRSGPEAWVIQGSPEWSAVHLEDDADAVARALLTAFTARAGHSPEPLTVLAHRWRYAKSGTAGGGFRWDAVQRRSLGGDWLTGPRVEAAWLSGRSLAAAMDA
jgi:renalase